MKKRLLITVGTTEFEELLERMDCEEFLSSVQSLGFNHIFLQYGRGSLVLKYLTTEYCSKRGIFFVSVAFTNSLFLEMKAADLIIGHAGAGTVLEVITLRKPFLCVTNSTLQGNHQQELAEALQKSNICFVTSAANVIIALQNLVSTCHGQIPAPTFPINHPEKFSAVIDTIFE